MDFKYFNEQLQIEEIILEARAYGLNYKVEENAKKLLNQNINMSRVDAYQKSYNLIINE